MACFDSQLANVCKKALDRQRREQEKTFASALVIAARLAKFDELALDLEALVGAALSIAADCAQPEKREEFRKAGAAMLSALIPSGEGAKTEPFAENGAEGTATPEEEVEKPIPAPAADIPARQPETLADLRDLVAIVPQRLSLEAESELGALGMTCNTDRRRKNVPYIWNGRSTQGEVAAIVLPHGGAVSLVSMPTPIEQADAAFDALREPQDQPLAPEFTENSDEEKAVVANASGAGLEDDGPATDAIVPIEGIEDVRAAVAGSFVASGAERVSA